MYIMIWLGDSTKGFGGGGGKGSGGKGGEGNGGSGGGGKGGGGKGGEGNGGSGGGGKGGGLIFGAVFGDSTKGFGSSDDGFRFSAIYPVLFVGVGTRINPHKSPAKAIFVPSTQTESQGVSCIFLP